MIRRPIRELLLEREREILRMIAETGTVLGHDALWAELMDVAIARAAVEVFHAEPAAKEAKAAPPPRPALPDGKPKVWTIAEKILAILADRPSGSSSKAITRDLNARFATAYPGTSVRPHLSRLAQAGRVTNERGLWRLVPADEDPKGLGDMPHKG